MLTFDYLGALGASLLFPLVLVPKLGMVRSALLFGIMNAARRAVVDIPVSRSDRRARARCAAPASRCCVLLGAGMAGAERISAAADNNLYADEVIFSRDTRYQRIVLTRWKDDIRLFLNSHLQFSSRDEYRYHEALVHPGLAAVPGARRVLVLGGGDGLAVREILKYPERGEGHAGGSRPGDDQAVLHQSNAHRAQPAFAHVAQAARHQRRRVSVARHESGHVRFRRGRFPRSDQLFARQALHHGRSTALLARHLSRQGLVVVQSTSPLFARQSYWCIVETLKQAGLKTYPYHVYVPSFGEWGFVLAGQHPYEPPAQVPDGLRFLSARESAGDVSVPERHAAGGLSSRTA